MSLPSEVREKYFRLLAGMQKEYDVMMEQLAVATKHDMQHLMAKARMDLHDWLDRRIDKHIEAQQALDKAVKDNGGEYE